MKKSFLILTLIITQLSVLAQDKFPGFIPSYDRFSSKKTSFVILKDNTKVEGTIDDLDRKKGLIEEIVLKPVKGKKMTLLPEDIQGAYLEPSGYSKLATFNTNITRLNKITKYDVNSELIEKGYVYFESSVTQLKKKDIIVLLQLLNPTFTGRIRIYDDPFATESIGVGVGGFTVAGGDSKSYYLKKDDQKAYRLKRDDFEDDFPKLFGDCPAVLEMAKERVKWTDLNKYVYTYNTTCTN